MNEQRCAKCGAIESENYDATGGLPLLAAEDVLDEAGLAMLDASIAEDAEPVERCRTCGKSRPNDGYAIEALWAINDAVVNAIDGGFPVGNDDFATSRSNWVKIRATVRAALTKRDM